MVEQSSATAQFVPPVCNPTSTVNSHPVFAAYKIRANIVDAQLPQWFQCSLKKEASHTFLSVFDEMKFRLVSTWMPSTRVQTKYVCKFPSQCHASSVYGLLAKSQLTIVKVLNQLEYGIYIIQSLKPQIKPVLINTQRILNTNRADRVIHEIVYPNTQTLYVFSERRASSLFFYDYAIRRQKIMQKQPWLFCSANCACGSQNMCEICWGVVQYCAFLVF